MIIWETDQPCLNTLYWGFRDYEMNKFIFDIETTQISDCNYVHKAVLDYSLFQPKNTVPIYYLIQYGFQFSWTYRFNTFSSNSNSDINLLLFGDNQYKKTIFQPLLHTISSQFQKPDFIVHVGDYAQVRIFFFSFLH